VWRCEDLPSLLSFESDSTQSILQAGLEAKETPNIKNERVGVNLNVFVQSSSCFARGMVESLLRHLQCVVMQLEHQCPHEKS